MSYLKPFTTLGVGIVLGWLVVPRIVRLVHK
jgi:hypothetical protein